MDVDDLAASLFPPAYDSPPFYNGATREVFNGLFHYLFLRIITIRPEKRAAVVNSLVFSFIFFPSMVKCEI